MSGAAAGAGTPARRPGCTARPIESIFGLQLGARQLSFTPCLPSHWPRAELCLSRDGRTMRFVFIRGDAQAALDALRDELPDAQLLRPSTALDWTALPTHSVFVVPLLDAANRSAGDTERRSILTHHNASLNS